MKCPNGRPLAPGAAQDPADAAARVSARLHDLILKAIADAGGRLPFDRFMHLALYAPGLGYYVAGAQKFGPAGDFVTAPEVSPLFGRCIAAQCAEVLERLGGGDLLELGAGSGAMAVQVLQELDATGVLPGHYRILEPSPELQTRQRARIASELPHLVQRCHWLTGMPADLKGVVLANEVLDAMPVHRFQVLEEREIHEVYVAECGGRLLELTAPACSPGLEAAVSALHDQGLACQPGYSSEINLRLAPWLSALSEALTSGLVLLIDYGYTRSGYYQADRTMGTLMCHHRQRAHQDPYRAIGLQDITAHVDFTAAAEAGIAAGFQLAGFTTQAHFLIGCGIDRLLAGPSQPIDLALGAKQLLLPTAMGERFKVLGLTKGLQGPWRGFAVRDLADRL